MCIIYQIQAEMHIAEGSFWDLVVWLRFHAAQCSIMQSSSTTSKQYYNTTRTAVVYSTTPQAAEALQS